MPGSFELGRTHAGDCVRVSAWSGLAAGLNNCLSSAAPLLLSSTPCVLIQSCCPGLVSSPLVTCVSSSRGAADIWICSSHSSCCGTSTFTVFTTGRLWSVLSTAELGDTRAPWSKVQMQLPELWARLSTKMHCIFFPSFDGVVISLLHESLMLAWLKVIQSFAGWWFNGESKRIVCGKALASVNRNTHLLSADCITCKTNRNQTAHLPHFQAIVMTEEGKMSSLLELWLA